jgi:hypothetical protein
MVAVEVVVGMEGVDLPSSDAPDGLPGAGQHLMLLAPAQKLEMVDAPLQVSELMLMQLPFLPLMQLV